MLDFQTLSVRSADGVTGSVRLVLPTETPRAAVYWLPALGVEIRPNERFAMALAGQGVAVAIHEWRGMGTSNVRAGRGVSWGYHELLNMDIPAGIEAARNALPLVPWVIGGHSLGAQLAMLYACRHSDELSGVWVVASGQPWWRMFSGFQSLLIWGLSYTMRPITGLYGYFPGHSLGFAGREAAGLMRDWAATARTGRYNPPSLGDDLTYSLGLYQGAIAAVRMRNDPYVPAESFTHLQQLAPRANWQVHVLDEHDFSIQRADHFSWLKDPGPVAHRLNAWMRQVCVR